MKNHVLYRYDYGWDTFERAECYYNYEDYYGHTPSDDELDKYINEINSENWDFMMEDIEAYEKNNDKKQYVILARIGTWQGTFDSSKIVTGLTKAISVCSRDCDFITVFYKNSQLKIVGHHHDGTNSFIIREMTDTGADYAERHKYEQTNEELHKRIFNSHRYSHMVSLFPKAYGWV